MFRSLLLIAFFIFPTLSHAQVMFSEVAWMGTDTDANDEWIELYNLSSGSTDLTGWTITVNDAPFISLAGTLTPHGIGVLERTDDNVLPGTALQIYTGALPNVGATLKLKDPTGTVTDQINSGANWVDIGGNNTVPKMTPQRTRTGSWVTGAPTPGVDNVQENVPVTEEGDDEGENSDDDDDDTSSPSNTRSSGDGASKKKVEIMDKEVLAVTIKAPRIAYVNQGVSLRAEPSGIGETLKNSLTYTWNFGDTYTGGGREVQHVFSYPGDYVVIVESTFAKQSAMTRHEITVLPVSISLTRSDVGDVVLKNNSKNEVDLGGYTIHGTASFIFPKFSILKPNATLIIAANRVQALANTSVTLRDALDTLLASDTQPPALYNAITVVTKPIAQKTVIATSYIPPKSTPAAIDQKVESAPVTTSGTEILLSEPSTIIAIGKSNAEDVDESPGFFKKTFSKIFSFFGLAKN